MIRIVNLPKALQGVAPPGLKAANIKSPNFRDESFFGANVAVAPAIVTARISSVVYQRVLITNPGPVGEHY
jgi:hypothetical protein